jgi:hypothetical protein
VIEKKKEKKDKKYIKSLIVHNFFSRGFQTILSTAKCASLVPEALVQTFNFNRLLFWPDISDIFENAFINLVLQQFF